VKPRQIAVKDKLVQRIRMANRRPEKSVLILSATKMRTARTAVNARIIFALAANRVAPTVQVVAVLPMQTVRLALFVWWTQASV